MSGRKLNAADLDSAAIGIIWSRLVGVARDHEFPGAPTFAELGSSQLPGLVYSLHVRAGTHKAIFDRIRATRSKALQQPQVVEAYANSRLEAVNASPGGAAAQLADMGPLFADVVERVASS
jgi:tripartite-type tricarboxylate transporter receptor subunit TctC